MQQISGLEFAKVVPKNVKIVFTTAFKEYAIEAYKVNAFDYLLKPITYDDFMGSCQKVFEATCRTITTTQSSATVFWW